MAVIPEDKLLEIKDAASLTEVIGQFVKLTQRGRNLVGLCPFHADTKPSFTVSPDKGIYYCFGCGAGGSVFNFLMQYHRLSFPEAVEELARRYGIPLTYRDLGPEGAKQSKKRQGFYDLHEKAAAFYRATLEGKGGAGAREYLAKRGLKPEVIQAFGLGYAPNEWDGLRKHLQSKGLSLDLAAEAGLLMPRASGGYYDRFRDRVIFPIQDRQGRVVAFGGRVMGEGEPKYLNSPESPLFSKSRLLYGLSQGAAAFRSQDLALVVEGYLDLLALKVHGIEPVCATLGTALTREHVRLLKSLVAKVVLVFDGDLAGAKAMCRAFPLFAAEGLAVRALPLPAGTDPDSYVFKEGPALFEDVWDAAQPWFAYVLEGLVAAHGLSIEGRVRLLTELKPYFQAVADPVEQDLWLKFAAGRLSVDEEALRRSLTSAAAPAAARLEPARHLSLSLEKNLLKWILQHPEGLAPSELEEWEGEFEDPGLKEILALALECHRHFGHLDVSLLIQRVEDEPRRRLLLALALGEEEFSRLPVDLVADDWRRALLKRRLKKAQAAILGRLARVAADDEEQALQTQKTEIDRQLEDLKGVP